MFTETPLDPQEVLGVPPERLPRHVAIIMDGNGRWAQQRGLQRIYGHQEGAKVVRRIVTHCARLGIEVLTLYSFSTENWKRPKEEIDFLMKLYTRYLISERETIMANDVRFVHIGRRDHLPESVLAEMDKTLEMSRENTGLKVCLALNYGGRDEIVDAIRAIARDVAEGKLSLADVDEHVISNSLYTAGLPDPDLLIRTANERRISNFLLWQISYAEIHVSPKCWPDFDEEDLNVAFIDFAGRQRRFGAVSATAGGSSRT
jgi:undecaprenyl diphosphate synthase